MLALLAAAATLTAQPAPSSPDIKVYRGPRASVLAEADMLCKPQGMLQAFADPALLYRKDGRAKVQPLGELPKANHEKAVARSVGGCANPMVVEYGAGR